METINIISKESEFQGDIGPFAVFKGPSQRNETEIVCQNVSNTSVTHTVLSPGLGMGLLRNVKVKNRAEITITGYIAPGQTKLINKTVCPRAMPFLLCTDSMSYNINNTTAVFVPKDVLMPILHGQIRDIDIQQNSECPLMLDKTRNYSDPHNEFLGNDRNYLAGPMYDVMATAGVSMSGNAMPRGAFPMQVTETTDVNGLTTAVIILETQESIADTPFDIGAKDKPLARLGTITVTQQFGNLTRLLSFADDLPESAFSDLARTIKGFKSINVKMLAASLHIVWITPNAMSSIPETLQYPHNTVTVYPTDIAQSSVPLFGQTGVITTQNIQLTAIPQAFRIFVDLQDADKTISTTDTYDQITGITIQYNNTAGQLATATATDLWRQNVINGLNQSYVETVQGTGTIFVLIPGLNLTLADEQDAAGVVAQRQISMNVTYKNTNSKEHTIAKRRRLMVVAVYSGRLDISDNFAQIYPNLLQSRDITNAPFAASTADFDLNAGLENNAFGTNAGSTSVQGAGIGRLKRFMKKGVNQAWKMAKPMAVNFAKGAVDAYLPRTGSGFRGSLRRGGGIVSNQELANQVEDANKRVRYNGDDDVDFEDDDY
jgi:hypothetical protein